MSADKALETALARIAALEARLTGQPAAPQPQGVDPQQLARALTQDTVGTLARLGVDVNHVSKVLVAHQLGDAAPEPLRIYAQQGPLMSATQAVTAEVQSLRQRLDTYEQRDAQAARRQSFNALAADKTKYPRLAAVMAKSPELLASELDSHQGDTASLADAIEQRLAALAPALGAPPPQPASQANAESTTQGQSTQAKQAQPGATGLDPTPPPIPQAQTGPWTPEMDRELRDRIIRKHSGEAEPRG